MIIKLTFFTELLLFELSKEYNGRESVVIIPISGMKKEVFQTMLEFV